MNRIIILVILAGLGLSGIFLLYYISDRPNIHTNGFKRNFKSKIITQTHTFDLGFNSYYIAGLTKNRIYLGNVTTPLKLLSIDYDCRESVKFDLPPTSLVNDSNQDCFIDIDSPNIYMLDYPRHRKYRGLFPKLEMRTTQILPLITKAIPVSPNSEIIRTFDSAMGQNNLEKIINSDPGILARNLLTKQLDGYFCTDGLLIEDLNKRRFVYLYYYRNQFICFDSNLNILYKSGTIDTNTTAKISLARILSENKTTLYTPPLIVNKYACMEDHLLFVNSNIKADNESKETYSHSSVIDMYDVSQGKYLCSFYIPDLHGRKLMDMRIFGNKLVTIHFHHLLVSTLNPMF